MNNSSVEIGALYESFNAELHNSSIDKGDLKERMNYYSQQESNAGNKLMKRD